MKWIWQWLLLAAALVQFGATALPPGNDDLISIHSLAFDLARGDDSLLYPGSGFVHNEEWIAHHQANLRKLGDRGEPNWCFYPPLVPYLTIPVAAATDNSWRLVWGAVQLVLVVLFSLLIARLLETARVVANRVLIFALVMGSFPVARSVELGQTSLVVALLMWSSVYYAQINKRIGAALLAGIAIFVKPFLFVRAAVDAARRRWWDVVLYTVAWLLLMLLSVAAVGMHAHVEYGKLLSTLGSSQTAFYGNQSLFGGFFRIFSGLPSMDYGFWSNPTLAWVGRLLAVAILGVAGWAQFHARKSEPVLAYGLWFSAASLALPISWEHHLIFVLPALALLWAQSKTRTEWIALTVITALLSVRWTFLYGESLAGRLAAGLPLLGNLALFIYLLINFRKLSGNVVDEALLKETDVRA